jgi:hypothetical protein
MSPLFAINFRREAYLREVARVRRRVLLLGGWVAYFGVLALVIGLYVLNGIALERRTRQVEVQVARAEKISSDAAPWDSRSAELAQVSRYLLNPRQWRVRLVRLAALTPPNVALTLVAVNPDNMLSTLDQNTMHIEAILKPRPNEDRMSSIMAFVTALRKDPQFAAGYQTIRLTQSQATGPTSDFTVECR